MLSLYYNYRRDFLFPWKIASSSLFLVTPSEIYIGEIDDRSSLNMAKHWKYRKNFTFIFILWWKNQSLFSEDKRIRDFIEKIWNIFGESFLINLVPRETCTKSELRDWLRICVVFETSNVIVKFNLNRSIFLCGSVKEFRKIWLIYREGPFRTFLCVLLLSI